MGKLYKLASEYYTFVVEAGKKKKPKSGPSFIFKPSHPKVKEGWHFPIDTKARARAALVYVNHYKKRPDWWKGSLKELIEIVYRAVKRKFPEIQIDEEKKKPGKG